MTTVTPPAIIRTSSGMVDALFETIDKLNRREIDAEHARAVSHTARSIVAVAHLELEVQKLKADQQVDLKSLQIEAKP